MEVHRMVVTVIDHDGLGAEGVKSALENGRFPNRCISPGVQSIETRDIGVWRDDHPLNMRGPATSGSGCSVSPPTTPSQ